MSHYSSVPLIEMILLLKTAIKDRKGNMLVGKELALQRPELNHKGPHLKKKSVDGGMLAIPVPYR